MDQSKSSSIFPIEIMVLGRKEIIEGEIVRTKAPRTVERILPLLPITGRVSIQKTQLNLSINIKMGAEKATKMAKGGDIAYSIKGDNLSIFLTDTEPYGEINVIGAITSNMKALSNLKLGSTLKIALKKV